MCCEEASVRGEAWSRAGRWRHAWVGVIALFASEAGMAAEWIFEPSIAVGATYDDNIDLATEPRDSVSGYEIVPRMRVRANTEASKTTLDAYVAYTDYRESDIVEDKSEFVGYLTDERKTSERGTLNFRGDYRRDTLFERVDFGTGTGDLEDVDIGLSTSTEVRRHRRTLDPRWTWLLSERSAIRLGYRFTGTSYANAAGTGLVDYRQHSVGATYSRSVTDRNDVELTVNAARFDPDIDEESRTLQVLGGLRRAFSDTLRGNFAAGVSSTRVEAGGEDDTSSGVIFRAGLEQRAERSTLDGVVSRDIVPSGLGRALETDQLRIRWTLKTAPTVDFVLRSHLLRNRVLEGEDPGIDRRYYEIEPELRWHWLPDLFVSGSYRYRRQKFDAASDAAKSNAYYLGLAYSP